MENRITPAMSVQIVSNYAAFSGDGANDNLVLTTDAAGYLRHNIPLSGNLVSDLDIDSVTAGEQKRLLSSLVGVSADMGAGDDIVDGSAISLAIQAYGGDGNDQFFGSSGNDYFDGGNNDDVAHGNGGNDALHGQAGNDQLFGDAGNDSIFGEAGNDTITDLAGNNVSITGDAGDDIITLAALPTTLSGGADNDTLQISGGSITLTDTSITVGGVTKTSHLFEKAILHGTSGNDTIDASAFTLGVTIIYGDAGNDQIKGGQSSAGNLLYGGPDADTIIAGAGANDLLSGDAGNDTVTDNGGGGGELYGGDDNDVLTVTGAVSGEAYYLHGEDGDDTLNGGVGDDELTGGAGTDTLNGGDGADSLIFDVGDTALGGAGDDIAYLSNPTQVVLTNSSVSINGVVTNNHNIEVWSITGGGGDDTFDASAFSLGGVIFTGGGGNDVLIAGQAAGNYFYGGAGNDTLVGDPHGGVFYGGDDDDTFEVLGAQAGALYGDGGVNTIVVEGTAAHDAFNIPNSGQFDFNAVNFFIFDISAINYFSLGGADAVSIATGLPFNVYVDNVQPTLSPSSVKEDQPAHTVVGTLSVPAPLNANGPYTYSLVAGDGSTDNGLFEIVSGKIRTLAVFDYTVQNHYSVRVRAANSAGTVVLERPLAITILKVDDPPVIGAFDTAVTYVENAAAALVDSNATVTDPDSADFDTGTMILQLISGAASTDRLEIRNQGTAAGQIGVSGTDVTFGGTVIGSFTGGTTSLTITFNANATPAAAQALLRNITYRSISDNPSATPKTIRVSINDGDGSTSNLPTKTITVTPVNDAPTIGAFDTAVTYVENAAALLVDSNATLTDPDSADLDTGKLILQFTAGGVSTDRLEIRNQGTSAGQIGVSGTDVTYGGTIIGSFTGGTTSLTITFNASATPAAAQALLRNITYRNISEAPSNAPKTLRVYATDGDGGTSSMPTKTVTVTPVNDIPVIGAFDADVIYKENAAAVLVDSNATIVDVDSPNLDTGKMYVSFTVGGASTDRLEIRNQGTAAGQIGVSGTDVTYGGVAIGSFTGTYSLTITFNASATPVAAQALLRNITYRNISEAPSATPKTLRVYLTDGDGGTSAYSTKTVTVTPVNDIPVIGAFDTAVTYVENAAAAVLIDSNATIVDVDSPNLDTGKMYVSFTVGGASTDRLEIRNQGTAAGQIGVSGTDITYGGVVIGSFTGTYSLTITFNASATPVAAQALLRNITYRTVSEAPSASPKTLRVYLTDGDGGTSAFATKTVTVTPVNDAPVLADPQASISHKRGTAAVLLASQATLTDVDSPTFGGGVLTVQVTANGEVDDLLEIRNQGTSAGQIGVSGTDITYGGVVIGSFTGGSGTTALSVTFNDNATVTAVRTLIRNLTFRTSVASTTNARTVSYSVTDGDGGTSGVIAKTVNLT